MAGSAWSIRVGVDLDTSNIQSQLNNATQNTRITLNTGGAQGKIDQLNHSFDITYQMANKIYQISKEAIGAMVREVYTVDKALTEFKKVSDLRGSGLDEYVKELGESGQIVARTTSDMIDAATMFKKSGFTESEAKDLAVMATMFQNISDVSVTAGDAAASIVSQLQAFGRGNLEAIHILDAYNKVAADFAVGTNDLSSAMEIAAAGMATYGNSFEQTIGLITAGTEIMQGRSSQVARGLNTIAANIVKQKDLLAEYGIEVADSNGNLKSTYDVLRELKPQWDKMTDAERNAVGITLAGKNQYRVLASIMTNFAHAVGATNDALNSSGTALQQNAAYMESLEARTTNIKALFQQLSLSIVDSDLIKGILDIAGALLQIANTDIGNIITQFVLLSGVITGITGMVIKGFDITSITLGKMFPYILAVTGALVGVLNTIELVKQRLQEKAELKTFDGVNQKIQESETKISEYDSKIKEASDKLKELNKIPFEERSSDINVEIARLEALIATYERLKQEEQNRQNKQNLNLLRGTQYSSGYTVKTGVSRYGSRDDADYGGSEEIFAYTESQLKELEIQYGSTEEAAYKYAKALNVNIEETDTYSDVIRKLADKGVVLTETYQTWDEMLSDATMSLGAYNIGLESSENPTDRLIEQTKRAIDENKKYYDSLKTLKDSGADLTQQELDFIKTFDEVSTQYTKATLGADNFKKAQEAIKGVDVTSHYSGQIATLKNYVDALLRVEGIDVSNVGQMLGLLKQLGYLNLDYTEEELQNILDKTGEIDESSADVDIDVDSEEAEDTFEDILSAQERLEAQGISIKSTTDAQDLLSSLELIEEKISAMSESSINIEVKGNVSKALSDINSISDIISSLPDSKNVSVLVKTSGVSELSNISSLLSGLKDKTVNVKVNVSQNGSFPFKADGDDNFEGGPVLINDGKPVNGSSAELVVTNNKAHIYNNGEPTVVNLPKGSKIFNAKDTQNILNSNKDLEFPAFQNGNASSENDGYKDLFDKWLEGKKYLLALNLITEEKYYKDLEDMNEKYLSNIEEAQADYWKHQEEIYKWKTSQIDSQNDALKEQLELEKSLKSVIGAHSNKVLVYKNGTFQYISDIDAIDSAKRSFYKLNDEAKEKSQYSINLGGNGAKVTGDSILKNDYQEIKKVLQDVRYSDLDAVEWGKKELVEQENYTFSIDNLSLPNAKDAAGILNGLKNYAYQYSYGK